MTRSAQSAIVQRGKRWRRRYKKISTRRWLQCLPQVRLRSWLPLRCYLSSLHSRPRSWPGLFFMVAVRPIRLHQIRRLDRKVLGSIMLLRWVTISSGLKRPTKLVKIAVAVPPALLKKAKVLLSRKLFSRQSQPWGFSSLHFYCREHRRGLEVGRLKD